MIVCCDLYENIFSLNSGISVMYSLQEDFHTVLVTSKMARIVEQACRVWGIIQNDTCTSTCMGDTF